MPKKVHKRFNPTSLQRWKEPGLFCDGGGLYLRCKEGGSKQWVFRFRFPVIDPATMQRTGQSDHSHGLGSVDDWTLDSVREEARRMRRLLRDGFHPMYHRRKEAAEVAIKETAHGKMFRQACAAFIVDEGRRNDGTDWNAKHAYQWNRTINEACAVFGDLRCADISRDHVKQFLLRRSDEFKGATFWDARRETARRYRQRLITILDYCKRQAWRSGDNPADINDKDLSGIQQARPVHHEALQYHDAPAFVSTLAAKNGQAAKALRFLILTCARTSEVLHATWSEVDFDNAIWTVAADRMKNRKAWRVPLAKQTVAFLKAHKTHTGKSEYLFPTEEGKNKGGPLSNMAMLALMSRMKIDAKPHGFRATFTDWSTATQSHIDEEIRELALAHTVQDKTKKAYRRSDFLEQRRPLAQSWADYVLTTKRGKLSVVAAAA